MSKPRTQSGEQEDGNFNGLITDHLKLASTSWSIGVLGAVAEFFRAQDEAHTTDNATFVVTARGAIRISAIGSMRVAACTAAGGEPSSIALCLPAADCSMHGRSVITEVGPDHRALRDRDRKAILFDLGLGSPYFDFHIRTADPAAIKCLRDGIGFSLFDPHHSLPRAIVAMHPHRVFVSRLGRIEVYQRIAGAGETTPDGPHTHLLPELLKTGRVHAPETPIPSGWIPCVNLYPGHPPQHQSGNDTPAH
jgi:hypothetical protein